MTQTMDWLELSVTVPISAQNSVTNWLMDQGASGVQENYPGLFPADGGPVISGDPSEWWGQAPKNTSGQVILTAWLPQTLPQETVVNELQTHLDQLGCGAPDQSSIKVKNTQDQDWNAQWKASWKATPIGERLLICPTWEDAPDSNRIVIKIDPGMAFGTGTHFTTATCLELIEEMSRESDFGQRTILDVGTGSGILAIGGLLLGAKSALGIDLDPDAAREAGTNAVENAVQDRFEVTMAPLSGQEGTFDIVAANLVAHTVIQLGPLLAGAVAPGGKLIVSGVLAIHEEAVVEEIEKTGMTLARTIGDGTWVTMVFGHRGLLGV